MKFPFQNNVKVILIKTSATHYFQLTCPLVFPSRKPGKTLTVLIQATINSCAAKCYWRKMLTCAGCHYKLLCNHSWIPSTTRKLFCISSHVILHLGYFGFPLSTVLRYCQWRRYSCLKFFPVSLSPLFRDYPLKPLPTGSF